MSNERHITSIETLSWWFGFCTCGWTGPFRKYAFRARRDGRQHEKCEQS